jgi:hypothetical protein
VPQSQEKTQEQTTDLPNPELNPLLNPTLGRHLGRWAQVYFTSPPEKREEAVEELLRELKGSPASTLDEPAPPEEKPIPEARTLESIRIVEAVPDSTGEPRCPQCGQAHAPSQRFCGMCGAVLEDERPVSDERLNQPVALHPDLPSLSPARESADQPDDGYSDVRWLRDKGLTGDDTSSWSRVRYAPAVIAVLAIGILFYAQSRSQKGPGPPQANKAPIVAAPSKPAVAQNADPSEKAPVEKAVAPPSKQEAEPQPAATTASVPPPAATKAEERRASAEGPPATPETNTAAVSAASGAPELAMAEDFLNGKTHPRNSEEAAKYLWRAVGKENATAILLLSDMYLTGDGVPKSCDQARLLLNAAAKKGVPQAGDKLRDLLRSGCPR